MPLEYEHKPKVEDWIDYKPTNQARHPEYLISSRKTSSSLVPLLGPQFALASKKVTLRMMQVGVAQLACH